MNTPIILLSALAIVLAFALVAMLLSLRRRNSRISELEQRATTAESALAQSEIHLQQAIASRDSNAAALENERKMREQEQLSRVKAETELEAERRNAAEKLMSQEQLREQLREQFRTLAGDVLGEQ
ncbi:MAG: hypothetical protein J6L75_00245, partial [Alistipes sp.]|nr:hypothetical protein [Alistipes sp.]